MRFLKNRNIIVAIVTILGISLGAIVPTLSSRYIHADIHVKGTATTPIQHVVVIMMENHSFDNMFGRFPGVNGSTLPRASNPFTSDLERSSCVQGRKVGIIPRGARGFSRCEVFPDAHEEFHSKETRGSHRRVGPLLMTSALRAYVG